MALCLSLLIVVMANTSLIVAALDMAPHLVGGQLPHDALETAKDSVGGGLGGAEQVARAPGATPQQAQAVLDAVHDSFAHGVARTSLVGGIVLAAGMLIVLAVLPGRRGRPDGAAGDADRAGGAGGHPRGHPAPSCSAVAR